MPDPTPPLVAIVTCNDLVAVNACLAAARQAGAAADFIVWDNGSTDGTADVVRSAIAGWQGWSLVAEAHQATGLVLNRLVTLAAGRDLVILFGNVIVHTPDWLAALAACAQRHPQAGVIGCKNLLTDGRVLSTGRQIVRALGMRDIHANIGLQDQNTPAPGQARMVDSVGPALAFYRHAALAACGGFDPRFPNVGWLQDDLCVAVRAQDFDVVCDLSVEATRQPARPEAAAAAPMAPTPHAVWQEKWGWNPEYPNLHAIRRRWGRTRVCWQIGERLLAPALADDPKVDIVIVTWNSLAKLRTCLESLAETDYPASRVIVHVLDNGSTDGTPAYLQSLLQPGAYRFAVRTELLPVNIGLPPALNLLIAKGTAPLVARLDDDVRLPKHWLRQFVEDLRRLPYAGVVGGKITNLGKPGLQHVGEAWCQKIDAEDHGQYDYLALTNHVRGCCNLYRRKAFEVAGLLDVRFNPSQFDDPDHHLALRAAGFDVVYDGRVAIEHHLGTGADASRKSSANARGNYQKMVGKWGEDAFTILDQAMQLSGRLLEDFRPAHLRPAPKRPARVA